jgi:hypothetical protein
MNNPPAITFTEEDRLIWRQIEWYSIGTDGMYAYRAAGRRDAELMYQAQRDRSFGVIGYMPILAKVPHDPFPYTGGVKLGYLARWRAECMLDIYDET